MGFPSFFIGIQFSQVEREKYMFVITERMNRSTLRTLKYDRNKLLKPSDEDASGGGRSAMVTK